MPRCLSRVLLEVILPAYLVGSGLKQMAARAMGVTTAEFSRLI